MKFKKIFPIVICSALLAGGSLLAIQGVSSQAQKANAETDVGTVTVASVRNNAGDHFDTNIYLVLNETTALPDSWDYPYTAVGEDSGVFINGEKQNGAVVKHANGNDIHYGLPRALSDNDIVEFKGTFATESDGGYRFSIDYATQRFGGDWILPLEDYDLISLKDANIPDFDHTAINTDDAEGYGYIGYDDSGYAKKYIGKRKGIFGYTNNTNSYAFQFNFEVDNDETLADWLNIRIGASGGWTTGHYLQFNFHNAWSSGCAQAIEYIGGTAQAGHNREVQTDITTGVRLLEVGSIKVKGFENKYYVFIKNNGTTAFGEYWDLAAGQRSTKIGMYYPGTNVTVSNTVNPTATHLSLSNSSDASGLYFNTAVDVLPFISSWSLWFTPVEANSVKYNDVDFSSETWNFFKKVGATTNSLYLNIADLHKVASYAPAVDDTLHIGGMFKMATYIDEVTVVYKVYIEDIDLQFDGTAWRVFDPNYSAVDFAKDLLKQTLTICTGAGGDNGEALTAVWATLAGSNYYGKLSNSEKADLAIEAGDSTVVVPTTSAGVDAMDDADAIAAGLYRYDYCTLKYSLTNFIDGRTPSLASAEMRVINTTTNVNVVLLITISAIVVGASLFVVLHFVSRKRKQVR